MSDVHWYGLDTLDGDLFREVCKFYSGPFQFVAAWDDEEECSQMLLEFFGGTRPADELNRLVRRRWIGVHRWNDVYRFPGK